MNHKPIAKLNEKSFENDASKEVSIYIKRIARFIISPSNPSVSVSAITKK